MTRWRDLVQEVSRRPWAGDVQTSMVVQVKRMADAQVCDRLAPYRIKRMQSRIALQPGPQDAHHPTIELYRLPRLRHAHLSFGIVVDRREEIVEYTVSVVGQESNHGRGWYVRIDLDPEPRGHGPCSHPLLHCHVGVDPEARDAQDVRVPLPWVDPAHALEWMLATLDPERFE